MRVKIILLLSFIFLFSCKIEQEIKSKKVSLQFLNDFVYPPSQKINGTVIGGLSGIDFDGETYYLVCDDANNPRVYKATINIENKQIKNVDFTDVVLIDKTSDFYKHHRLDLESIVIDNDELVITSEGAIGSGKNPTLFTISKTGSFINQYKLPARFLANSNEKPRNNGSLEGLTKSFDKKGFWTAMELPLEKDAPLPAYKSKNNYVRFTYFDKQAKKATKEYAYELSGLPRKESILTNINGVTDVLQISDSSFLVLERAYQNGYVGDENIINIFLATITTNTTNTLNISNLADKNIITLQKERVFDFASVKEQLKEKKIDNIEGITFGPRLKNGKQSIILVADDNFQSYGKQLNQFVLLQLDVNF